MLLISASVGLIEIFFIMLLLVVRVVAEVPFLAVVLTPEPHRLLLSHGFDISSWPKLSHSPNPMAPFLAHLRGTFKENRSTGLPYSTGRQDINASPQAKCYSLNLHLTPECAKTMTTILYMGVSDICTSRINHTRILWWMRLTARKPKLYEPDFASHRTRPLPLTC